MGFADEYSNKQMSIDDQRLAYTAEWSQSLFGCFGDISTCAMGMCCAPCLYGQTSEIAEGDGCVKPCLLAYCCGSAPSACGLPLAATRCATCGSSSTVASLRAPASTGAAALPARTAKRPASSSLTISLLIRIGRPPRLPSLPPMLPRAPRKQHSLTSGCVPSHQLGEVVTKLVSHGEVAPGHTPIEHTKLAHSAVPFRSGVHEEYSEISACPRPKK